MASTRPRRSLQATTYKEMFNSDSEESNSADSDSELSDDSNTQRSTSLDTELFRDSQVIRLPTAVDILQTRELIRAKETELAVFETEYQAMKRKFEAFTAKRNAIARELLEHKAHIARVRALPQEVLGLVFLFYTDDATQSPWTLMQVTRAWRATALYTRAIWAKIVLSSPAWQKYGASRTRDGRELCGSPTQLDIALRRAGNTPLDIVVSLTNPNGGRYSRTYDRKAFQGMFNHLSFSRKCLQVQHLEINGPCGGNLNWGSYWCGYEFPALLKFPNLTTFSLKSTIESHFLTKLWDTFEETRRVQLLLQYSFNDAQKPLESVLGGSKLVSLSLNAKNIARNATVFKNVLAVLDNNSIITSLELTSFCFSNPDPATSLLRLPNLQHLTLTGSSVLCPLEAPLLLSITLIGGSSFRAGPPGSNDFPLLTSLIIDTSDPRTCTPKYLKHMQIHQIHTLEISFGGHNDHFIELMAHQADLNPIVFRLRKSTIATTLLTKLIGSMERLEELQLEGVSLKKDFFDFLTTSKANHESSLFPSDEVVLQCPLLVRLQVDLHGNSVVQNKIAPAVKRAFNSRVKAGIVMETWLIRFSEEKGWVDFLA